MWFEDEDIFLWLLSDFYFIKKMNLQKIICILMILLIIFTQTN